MTDKLTDDERAYYRDMLREAISIANLGSGVDFNYSAWVFEKIASPLHYLRSNAIYEHKEKPVDRVEEQNTGASRTRFRRSKAPDAEGFTEFATEKYVKKDLMAVLHHLRSGASALKSHKGYVYKLSNYMQTDFLWRKKEAPK